MKTKHHHLLRWPHRLMRATAASVLVAFCFNFATPTLLIAKEADRWDKLTQAPKRTEFDDVSDTLIQLEEALDRMNRRLQGQWEFEWQAIANRGGQTPPSATVERAALRALEDELDAAVPRLESLQGHVRAYFAQTRRHIEERDLAAEILARHDASANEYEQTYGQLKALLHDLKTAHDLDAFKAAVAAADTFMKAHSSKPLRAEFDPNTPLAFGPGKHRAGEPRTDSKAIRKALGLAEPEAKTLARDADTKAAPTAAELAATEDVQLTEFIRAKASELGNSPVAIYDFVRNNVEFLPTYGSIQGAEQTLRTLRGNAFDQASLLIALLRASDIPARYAYGVVELPIDQVQNWVGGTTAPQAALELLGQGGIPNMGLTEGGVFKKARLEHVWVEAYVDFVPSRGAKHREGDTWVPLDPSFKQYDFAQGMNLAGNVSFDAQGFAEQLTASATVNEAEGWVQGVDQAYVQQQLSSYAERLTTYVESQDADATLGEVIGSKRIRQQTASMLAGTLPYTVNIVASRSAALPADLRWQFRFALDGQMLLERSLPQLAGKTMALSFKPASQADEDALKSLIPADADGPEDLPTSIPTSLVKLTAEFSVDGESVATGTTRQLGTELMTRKGLYIPGQGWQETDNPFTVGDYQAVGVDPAGLSKAELEAHKARMEATKAKLDARDFAGLGKHDLTGAILQTGVMSYFAQTFAKARIAAQASGVVSYRLPSYGTVATDSQVQYWFGIPRNFSPKGVLMDMDRIGIMAHAKNGEAEKWRAFNQSMGSLFSAHEHSVLEELFDDRDTNTPKAEGMSAVKALAVAAAQGQRTYAITNSNVAGALARISMPAEVEHEIAFAASTGKRVTVHESAFSYAGQSSVGYVIVDQETGGGAYKILGGADGGRFFDSGAHFGAIAVTMIAAAFLAGVPFFGAILAVIMIGIFTYYATSMAILIAETDSHLDRMCIVAGFVLGVEAMLAVLGGLKLLPIWLVVALETFLLGLGALYVDFPTRQQCIEGEA